VLIDESKNPLLGFNSTNRQFPDTTMGVPFDATKAVIISSASAGSAIDPPIWSGLSIDENPNKVETENVTVCRIRN
jgi:hypothetical protein